MGLFYFINKGMRTFSELNYILVLEFYAHIDSSTVWPCIILICCQWTHCWYIKKCPFCFEARLSLFNAVWIDFWGNFFFYAEWFKCLGTYIWYFTNFLANADKYSKHGIYKFIYSHFKKRCQKKSKKPISQDCKAKWEFLKLAYNAGTI